MIYELALEWLMERLREPSTWRGLVLLITGLGVQISPETSDHLVTTGLAMAGLMGAVTPDRWSH
ncbi:MAG: hypothetical protein HQL51_10135 [Magnetococcales bacterium]|nr:hypothetical protein [Magnetococcales bacterium]